MAQFFERNKRKSALAALLLLFGRRRDLGLLLLMAAALLFVFVVPADFNAVLAGRLSRLPGGTLLAAALGVSRPSFDQLVLAFRAARRQDARGLARMFWRYGASAGSYSGLDYVRGSQSDLAGGDIGAKIGGNTTINGILTPDDARRSPGGVALDPQDLAGLGKGGLVPEALGAGVSAPYAAPGFFSGGAAAAAPDVLGTALSSTKVPAAARAAVASGRYSRAAARRNPLGWSALTDAISRGLTASSFRGACLGGGSCAFSQLTVGRAQAMVSRDPACTPAANCPPEYAAIHSGSVYDGNSVGANAPQVVTTGVTQLDGINGTPNAPDAGAVNGYQNQADQLQQQQAQCQQADETYNPQEQQYEDQIQGLSNDMNSLNCGGGGCSAPGQCQSDGNQMKAACRNLDVVMEAHYNACPIMQQNGPYQHQDCH